MPTLTPLMNAVPKLVLRAPVLHQPMSGRYLVLEFTGRKSGRRFRTPVAYLRRDDALVISTDSPWWRNLVSQPDVGMWLHGRKLRGRARLVDEETQAVDGLAALAREIPGYRRAAGLRAKGGTVPDTELRRALDEGRRVFWITGR